MEKQLYDVIIIGTGVAGLSAGMYAGRFNLKTLVIGELPGGIITTTHLVENYPGIPSITGFDMGSVFMEHAQKFGAQLHFAKATEIIRTAVVDEKIQEGQRKKVGAFKVKAGNEEFFGKTIIYATGTEYKKLGVQGEKELSGKGVSYCALCDGAFFKGKICCVVGGGDSSAIETLILAEHASKVYQFVRKDVLRAEPVNLKKVMEHPKIEVRFNTEIKEIQGDAKVTGVTLKSGEQLPIEGVFIAVGHLALSGLLAPLGVELDTHGQVKINRRSETNVPGIFAAGDVCDTPFKQAITGASEGVVASYFAYQFVQQHDIIVHD